MRPVATVPCPGRLRAYDAPDARQLAQTELPHAGAPVAWKAGAAPGAVQDRWLTGFADPRLAPLAEEALRHNIDLRAAALRVEAAMAAVKAAGGGLYPGVNVLARTGGKATGASGQLAGILVSASWEIDLWGRVRYGVQAADAQYASTRADFHYAQQSIVATLAKAWFLAAEAAGQQRLVANMNAAAQLLVKLAEERLRVGIGAEADVVTARANLQTYRDNALQIDFALAQSRRTLEMLLGRRPAAEIELPSMLVALPAPAASGLPSELLERRPDVIAAERRVAASFARVGEAGVARLSRILLTAALSSVFSSVFMLQQSADPSLGFGATLFYPLFNGGQLEAQVELRTNEQKQAAAAFAQTAQRAFNEVEGALAAEAALAAREPVLRQGLADTTRALDLEQVRDKIGSRDLRSVAQQQLGAYAAGMALLRVQSEQRVQRVQLHLVLGGDFGNGAP